MQRILIATTLLLVGLVFTPVQTGALVRSSTIFSDTFTDTNGTSLASHTPDVGSGWTIRTGAHIQVQGNRAEYTTDTSLFERAWTDVNDSDVSVQADLNVPSGSDFQCALLLRGDGVTGDPSDHLYVDIVQGGGGGIDIRIVKFESGTETVLDTTSAGSIGGTSVTLKATTNGTAIKMFLNGTEKGTGTVTSSLNSSSELFGFHGYHGSPFNANCSWDNMTIDSDPGGGGGGGGATILPPLISRPRGGGRQ